MLSTDLNLVQFIKNQKNVQILLKCQNLLSKERLERLNHIKDNQIDLDFDSSE
jgi:hypothetical protein